MYKIAVVTMGVRLNDEKGYRVIRICTRSQLLPWAYA